ncbi:tumor protein p53 inducible nuclear protein isoform 2-T4 [Cochliomyia hominivorax]
MFSSLASFLFGSNTNCETNSETTATTTTADNGGESNERDTCTVDADNLIEVTSLTPSVTGAGGRGQSVIKRGKNRRNNARQQNKRKGINKSSGGSAKASSPLTAKQLTVPNSSDEEGEEFDEDEWFIVEKEDEEEDASPSRSDSEGENVPVIEVVKTAPKPLNAVAASSLAQQRRLQHINSHSLYSGPRPQKQRNYLQKTRNNTNNRSGSGLSVSTLSPSRTVNNDGRNGSGHEESADGGITRSLYVAPNANSTQSEEKLNTTANGLEACNKMDESCMSVYHSIKTAQEATESFIKLDIGVNDMAEKQKANETTPKKNNQAVQSRNNGSAYRLDRQSVAQLKQELMARNVQKKQTKKERKDICRTAIKRANKVRDTQSRNHTQRRSDRQHSKIFSNANNNRKSNCC